MLRDKYLFSSVSISTTYTDADGYYCFIFDPNDCDILLNQELNLFIRVYAESFALKAVVPFLECFNYFDTNTVEASASDPRIININRRLKKDDDFSIYKLIYIQQGMVVGQRFAFEMGMQPTDMLYVFCLGDLETLSKIKDILLPFVNADINSVALCYGNISFIGHTRYNNFYTAIHEYGHFVEHTVDTYGPAVTNQIYEVIPENYSGLFITLIDFCSRIFQVMNDYTHDINMNHFDKANTSKDFQMELAWSEAWASAFAEIAFNYYKNNDLEQVYSSIANFKTETKYSYDGEAQEYAVTSFLWDLFDPKDETETTETTASGVVVTSEDDDNISMTEQEWWDLTTAAGTYTLQDFSENIINNYPELIGEVGEIMSKHNIAPKITYDSYNHATNASPGLKWNKNGGASYPNDIFRVAIYDNENNLMGITDEINDYTNALTFFIPTDLWNSVMAQEKDGIVIYAVVYGYRSGSFTSGPYFSQAKEIYNHDSYHSSHTKEYLNSSNTQHTVQCSCGYTGYENHEIIYSLHNFSNHKIECKCGYSAYVNHNFVYLPYQALSHKSLCDECGYFRTEPHITSVSISNGKICIKCFMNVSSGGGGNQYNSVTGITYITEGGSYVRADGIIVLSETDYLLYLSGELDLDSLINHGCVTQ